jgi:hypothetical protein
MKPPQSRRPRQDPAQHRWRGTVTTTGCLRAPGIAACRAGGLETRTVSRYGPRPDFPGTLFSEYYAASAGFSMKPFRLDTIVC